MRGTTIADAGVSRATAITAIIIAAILAAATAGSAWWSHLDGPVVPSFIPICAALWIAGDLLTGFLVFAHYRVTGRVAFLTLACAYLVTGLLSVGYMAAFPGIFYQHGELQQVALYLWLCWHAFFSVLVGVYFWCDPALQAREIDAHDAERLGWVSIALVAVGAAAIVAVVWLANDRLPHLIEARTFLPAYQRLAAPLVAVLALAASIGIWVRASQPRALHVWMSLALFVMALDSFLNAIATKRYTVVWYVGKFETLVMATVLLAVLLHEIAQLYGQTAAYAMQDALTGLRNRRSFDEAAAWLLALSRRRKWAVAAFMIDIDRFKQVNDAFGHPAGDRCLRLVAATLRRELPRGSDLVARYGGEEFAVLLADVDCDDARRIAERVRAACEGARDTDLPNVTVSIGMAWCGALGADARIGQLLASADAALYEAKNGGRNRTVLAAQLTAAPNPN